MLQIWTIIFVVILFLGLFTAFIFRKNKSIFFLSIFITVSLNFYIMFFQLDKEANKRNIYQIEHMIESNGGNVVNIQLIHEGRSSKTYQAEYELAGRKKVTIYQINNSINLSDEDIQVDPEIE